MTLTPTCTCEKLEATEIVYVQDQLPAVEAIEKLSEFFAALKDPTRLRILHALFVSSMCVCDIASTLGMSQSAISHQLKILRQAALVRYEKRGKSVFYYLADDYVHSTINQSYTHIME